MKKRILAIASALALLVSFFTGCSGLKSATDSELVTLDESKVTDIETDSGLLTVRYFLLDSEEKSGDSILVHTPDNKYILIDAGRPDCGEQVVANLRKLGVTRLDAIFNTHPHVDHLGGFPAVINVFPVGIFYRNPVEYTDSEYYNNTVNALEENNIPVQVLKEGDEVTVAHGVTVKVYNPPADLDPEVTYPKFSAAGKMNQQSLALLFTYKDIKMIFDGDLYKQGEKDMLARYPEGTFDADLVHAPHHGADSSTDTQYVKATTPIIAVMSSNGLQSKETYKSYQKNGSIVLSTALNGNLKIQTDGTKESFHAYVSQQIPPSLGKKVKG